MALPIGWPGQLLLAGSLLAAMPGWTAEDPKLPLCPAGWRLDVVLRSPRLRHPSVVCCAPDGRVFVAEDPMDISAPRADLRQGRILCLHPDGRVTTFADRLHAVFGMQYIDGRLFVLHNPEFSVFADGGDTGRDEQVLIKCTNPNPWALDWNDHVPANFRLAMDGYLYVAVGDKGIYGAVGRDGKRVDMQGGGILRLRPDGTGLEVYCTGVRNILDVALDAEDELFTYDNTDEHDWMSRLTHMVDGGDYGYPFDFVPRRPYTLWMMADYGGGAATGACATPRTPCRPSTAAICSWPTSASGRSCAWSPPATGRRSGSRRNRRSSRSRPATSARSGSRSRPTAWASTSATGSTPTPRRQSRSVAC